MPMPRCELLQLCKNSSRFCNIVLQEGAVPPLVALSLSGTPRARESGVDISTIPQHLSLSMPMSKQKYQGLRVS